MRTLIAGLILLAIATSAKAIPTRELWEQHSRDSRTALRTSLTPADAGPVLPLAPDTTVARLVGMVSQDSLTRMIRELQGFGTRYSYYAQCESAAQYLRQRFEALGLAVRMDTYYLTSPRTRAFNVEATYTGQVHPESVVIACAHYDSYSEQGQQTAPGADDNATGTAACVEIARALVTARFRWTVKLLCFSGEEQWMKGSYHWVDSTAVPQQMKIAGVYNLDMFGYTAYDSNQLYVIRNAASLSLATLAESANVWYGIGLRAINFLDEDCAGDNTPFWEHGYKAVFALEDSEWGIWNGSNPHYHTSHDTIGNLRLSQVTRATKMTAACVATLAAYHSPVAVAEPGNPGVNPTLASRSSAFPSVFAGSLSLPGREHEQFMLYDASGRSAGVFSGSGIAQGLAPGIYFLRDRSADRAQRVVKVR